VWHRGNGWRNVWIHDTRCILASPTFRRVHHAEVAVAWVVRGFPPDSWDSKLQGSLFPSVPSYRRKNYIAILIFFISSWLMCTRFKQDLNRRKITFLIT
jgi:hypothetical protein